MGLRTRPDQENGFALVVVIWAIGLLALLFATYVGAARYRSIEAASLLRAARADALTEVGFTVAVLDLLAGKAAGLSGGPRFGRTGVPAWCRVGLGGSIAVAVSDEGGKVDLNNGSPELIEALFSSLNREAGPKAARDLLTLREAAAAAQQARGVVATPTPTLRSIYELQQLHSLPRSLHSALLPLVTVHSKSMGIDVDVAPLGVLTSLAPGGARSRAEARRAITSSFNVISSGTTFTVSIEAAIAGGRAARDVVIELTEDLPSGYRVLEQRDGSLDLSEAARELLPC